LIRMIQSNADATGQGVMPSKKLMMVTPLS
jgi:hypothetical protein